MVKRRVRVTVVGVVILALIEGLAAQSRDPIRVATRLVQVHVIVRDRDGNAIKDLTKADFKLTDGGREQSIEMFEVESDAVRPQPAPLPPGMFSNEFTVSAATSATVILIDKLNTSMVDQIAVREQAIKFMQEIRPTDRVGIYLLDNSDSIRVLHDFTADAASLIKALKQIKPRTSNEVAAAEDVLDTSMVDANIDPQLLEWARGVDEQRQIDVTRDRVRHTNAGLATIADRMAGIEGRKSVVWISSGFPISMATTAGRQTSLAPDINSGLLALNDANVAVYPVDARRLIGAFATPASARQQEFTTLSTVRNITDTLELVAEETGGRAFFNSNDLTGAMRRAIDDGQLMYVLGYYPSHERWNNQFREIKVQVNRRGADVRHRRGYVATPTPSRNRSLRDARIKDAAQSPVEMTGIGLLAQAVRAEGQAVTLAVRIDPNDVALEKTGDKWTGEVDLLVAQASGQGAHSVLLHTTLSLALTDEQREKVMASGLALSRGITLQNNPYQLKIVARDAKTGAIGTLIIPANKLK
jgi:VWFA-related protein